MILQLPHNDFSAINCNEIMEDNVAKIFAMLQYAERLSSPFPSLSISLCLYPCFSIVSKIQDSQQILLPEQGKGLEHLALMVKGFYKANRMRVFVSLCKTD